MKHPEILMWLRKYFRMPVRVFLSKVGRRGMLLFRRVRVAALGAEISYSEFLRALVGTEAAQRLSGLFQCETISLNDTAKDDLLHRLKRDYPDSIQRTIEAAEEVCGHIFDLMGSGTVHLGDAIDWHKDYVMGSKFPPGLFFADVHPAAFPGGNEILAPWELSRFQHGIWLGQAYWFTEDRKFADEFVAQVRHWIEHNPVEYGVNWACTMDVAIRVVNWLRGFALIQDAGGCSEDFLMQFSKSLLAHGRFIRRNLENLGKTPGNHYLSDLVGLLHLGLLLPEFQDAAGWRYFSMKELERQIRLQVYDDGLNFEDSTNYHRLVTEMLLVSAILATRHGQPFSQVFMERLEKMIEAVMFLSRPDGTVPQIGDSDNGRLLRLRVWDPPEREWQDYRYLLAIGAVVYNREDFGQAAGDQWEEAYWLLGREAWKFRETLKQASAPEELPSKVFPDAGLAVLRGGGSSVLVSACRLGQDGKGGHSHNDRLSFELFTSGQAWIVDPGTGCYSGDYHLRNRMRSTASHNVIRVNGEEQHQIDEEDLFRLKCMGSAEILDFSADRESAFLAASHDMYNRLGVSHVRTFAMQHEPVILDIEDRLVGEGETEYEYEAFLHLAPGLRVSPGAVDMELKNEEGQRLQLSWKLPACGEPAGWEIIDSLYSPSYGVVQPTQALRLVWRAKGETMLLMQFRLVEG